MKRASSSLLVALVSAAAAIALGAGSRFAWKFEADDRAVLRLSWRAPGGRVESCRTLTPEEEARVPAHMRRSEVCESVGLPYVLRLVIDDAPTLADTIHPAGARADRPVVVFREIELEPGPHDIEVEFVPLVPAESRPGRSELEGDESEHDIGEADSDEDEDDESEHGIGEADREEGEEERPEALRLTGTVRLDPREVALVTYDPRLRALVLRQPSQQGGS